MKTISNPPDKLCKGILHFVYACNKRDKTCRREEILKYIDKTPRYVNGAIDFLLEQGVLTNGESISLSVAATKQLDLHPDAELEVLKHAIANSKELTEYAFFISRGKRPEESARLVKTLYELSNSEENLMKIFNEWIIFLGIDINQQPVKNKTIERIEESVGNRLLANKFVKEELGKLYSDISPHVIQDLTDAVVGIRENTEQSINDAGRALEDYLRLDLAADKDLSKCAGIVQISNELNKFSEYPTKLNNISCSLGNVRSMGKAHGVDAKIRERWSVNESTAMSYIVLVIATIRSYQNYKKTKSLIF